ncbi:MAG: ABC transporter substrate-binding protein [Rhodospirillales bacterium]|nr:ABC transporter substrate-binding protein [Rhodospirillales bacterium]
MRLRWFLSVFFALLLIAPAVRAEPVVLTDSNGRTVTLPGPAKRVVSLMMETTTVMLTMGMADRLVGVDKRSAEDLVNRMVRFDEHPVPAVGETKEPNVELIVSLQPDLILTWGGYGTELADSIQERSGIPVLCLHTLTRFDGMRANYRLTAEALGSPEAAAGPLTYMDDVIGRVTAVTDMIPASEKPRVHLLFWSFWNGVSRIPIYYDPVQAAGGVNIAAGRNANVYGYSVKVPVEQVIVWNPDIILIHGTPKTSKVKIEQILRDPRMADVNAVLKGRVHYTLGMQSGWHMPRNLTEMLYMAKRFHPDKFPNLDPRAEGDAIYERLYGKAGLWTARGRELGFID